MGTVHLLRGRWAVVLCLAGVASGAGEIKLGGRIVDDETGEVVTRFMLQWGFPKAGDPNEWTWGGGTMTGSRKGTFRIHSFRGGGAKTWVRVVANGYLPEPITPKPFTPPLVRDGLVVRLKRGATLGGRVGDHEGRPVADADVYLLGQQLLDLQDGRTEAFRGTVTQTDQDGRFALRGAGAGPVKLAVSSKRLHVWLAEVAGADREAEIRLPPPARLALRYDIPGDEDTATFRLELKTWEIPAWKSVVTSVQRPTAPNGGETVLANVAPGTYDLARTKTIRMGDTGRGAFCDRRTVVLKAGTTAREDFVRKTGWPIVGEVLGLAGTRAPGAIVTVQAGPPTGAANPTKKWKLPTLDALGCGRDGHFRTARIPPGEYTVCAEASEPPPAHGTNRFSTGRLLPGLIGEARVVILKDVPPPRVLIPLAPRPPRGKAAASPAAAKTSPPRPLTKLWDALADEDAVKGYQATEALAARGPEAVALLAGRLSPAAADPGAIRRCIADLDSAQFAARQKATADLYLLARAAEPMLRTALRDAPGAEKRDRIQALLKALNSPAPTTPALRRTESAVRILERSGTPPARAALRKLAAGAAGAYVTEQARAALQRLAAQDRP